MCSPKDIDCDSYVEIGRVKARARVRAHDVAPWLYCYFNNTPCIETITGITEGKEYMMLTGSKIRFIKEEICNEF